MMLLPKRRGRVRQKYRCSLIETESEISFIISVLSTKNVTGKYVCILPQEFCCLKTFPYGDYSLLFLFHENQLFLLYRFQKINRRTFCLFYRKMYLPICGKSLSFCLYIVNHLCYNGKINWLYKRIQSQTKKKLLEKGEPI